MRPRQSFPSLFTDCFNSVSQSLMKSLLMKLCTVYTGGTFLSLSESRDKMKILSGHPRYQTDKLQVKHDFLAFTTATFTCTNTLLTRWRRWWCSCCGFFYKETVESLLQSSMVEIQQSYGKRSGYKIRLYHTEVRNTDSRDLPITTYSGTRHPRQWHWYITYC